MGLVNGCRMFRFCLVYVMSFLCYEIWHILYHVAKSSFFVILPQCEDNIFMKSD